MKEWLFRPPSQDDLVHLLQAWRIWLLATLLGAILAWAVYALLPPTYRARAAVSVDQNLEQAWSDANTERELMTYLSRETQKLIQVAWEDATLELVVQQVPGTSISSLRSGILQLSQPGEGAWHFWADDPDSQKASRLASAWAKAFYQRSSQAMLVANQLQAAQAELEQASADPTSLLNRIQQLEDQSLGISPYLQISLDQIEQLPVERTLDQGTAILVGVLATWFLTLLILLFIGPRKGNIAKP